MCRIAGPLSFWTLYRALLAPDLMPSPYITPIYLDVRVIEVHVS